LLLLLATASYGIQSGIGRQQSPLSLRPFLAPGVDCLKKVAFFHVPKTGGRAIIESMANFVQEALLITKNEAVGMSISRTDPRIHEPDPMRSHDDEHPYFVEFHTTEARAGDIMDDLQADSTDNCGIVTATVLRDPVMRTVSMLDYDMETGCLPAEARDHADLLFGNVSDQTCRFLAPAKKDGGVYCPVCGEFWNSAKNPLCQPVSAEQQQATMQLIKDDFDVVGISENMDAVAKRVLLKMGFSQEQVTKFGVQHKGVTKQDTESMIEQLPDSWISSIREHGTLDFDLYEVAKQRDLLEEVDSKSP